MFICGSGDEASESVVSTGPDTLTNANDEIVDGETKGPAALQETEPKEDTSPSASVSQEKAPAANEADEVTEPAPVEQTGMMFIHCTKHSSCQCW